MYRYFVVIFVLCASCSAKAQHIVYDLPEPVIQQIDKHISFYSDTTKFAILFSSLDSGKYRISILKDLWSFKEIDETLIQKTNRFVRVNKMLVPMITRDDITFADFGTVYTPESKSDKRKVGKKKIHFTDDSKGIIFDKDGRIYQ
jgi:hypothetical protein